MEYSKLIIEWSILILILGFGVYTMYVIKNEKKNFLKDGKTILFNNFKLYVPKWWGEVATNSPLELCFKRLDTRYEWEAHFIWNETPSEKDLIELFKDHITDRKILFDTDSTIIYNPTDFKNGPLIQSGNFEMVRIEGTATYDRHERLYYDAFLIRNKSSNQFLYAESKSSVLNGLVEGPYFEEVMTRLESV